MTDEEYETIAAAVLETERGRWFLAEHARRNRHADTRLVLQAIERLEQVVTGRGAVPGSEKLRLDLVDMMNAITRTKSEIASIKPSGEGGQIWRASNELDGIVETTEQATGEILGVAERIQEIAWRMREQGIEPSICDQINASAAEIYTACSFQDLTGQRIRKVIQVLRFLEARIDAMIKIWRLDDLEMIAQDGGSDITLVDDPALRNLQQPAVDELIEGQRREDVFWREIKETGDPTNLGDFDLEDLEVVEVPIEEPPVAPASFAPSPESASLVVTGEPPPPSEPPRPPPAEAEEGHAGNGSAPAPLPDAPVSAEPPSSSSAAPAEPPRDPAMRLTAAERLALYT